MANSGDPYKRAVSAGIEAALGVFCPIDAETARSLAQRLLASSPEHRRLLLTNLPNARRIEVAQEVLREVKARFHGDPALVVQAAEIAVEVAEAASALPEALQHDLRAETWAALANALRIAERFDLAEAAWRIVRHECARGTGDPMLQAEIMTLKGSLRMDQGKFRVAERLMSRAARIYDRVEAVDLAGRTLISLGMSFWQEGQLSSAIQNTFLGARSIEPRTEPLLAVVALHNLAEMYLRSHRSTHCLHLLARAESAYGSVKGVVMHLRLRWVIARLLRARGYLLGADRQLETVRRGLLSFGTPYDAALVALDQAAIYAQLGEHAKVRELAREMIPVFRSKRIVREARVALALFVRASRAEALTAEAIAHFSRRVENAATSGLST